VNILRQSRAEIAEVITGHSSLVHCVGFSDEQLVKAQLAHTIKEIGE
jgi:hypothetical protein